MTSNPHFSIENRPDYGVFADESPTGLSALQGITEDGLLRRFEGGLQREYKPFASLLGGFRRDIDGVVDGQLSINHRVDLLGLLLDYGAAYMDALSGFKQSGQMPFNKQIGPMKGCELLSDGRIRLGSAGQWNIFSQLTVDWLPILDPNVWLVSRVRKPDGSEYSVKEVRDASNWVMSLTCVHPVVVPAEGYTVEIEAKFSVARKVLGGPARNHLVVQHVSDSEQTIENVNEEIEPEVSLQSIVTRPPDTWSESDWEQVAAASNKTVEEMKQDARDQGYEIP